MSPPELTPPAPCWGGASSQRPRAMTAEIQDRRVTVPILGPIQPASVDWSRLYWAFPARVHEGLGPGPSGSAGYKVMRRLPHVHRGPVLDSFRRLAPTTFVPTPQNSRRARRCQGRFAPPPAVAVRPAVTAAARGADARAAGRDEETSPGRTKKLNKRKEQDELASPFPLDFPAPIQGWVERSETHRFLPYLMMGFAGVQPILRMT
jgi:hypothetical protein